MIHLDLLHLLGKLVYRECCKQNVSWDEEVTDAIMRIPLSFLEK